MLYCKDVCDAKLRKINWCQKKIKLKEFKRRTAETKELFGTRKCIRIGQSNTRKLVCEEIALELSAQGGPGQAYRKSQTCLRSQSFLSPELRGYIYF